MGPEGVFLGTAGRGVGCTDPLKVARGSEPKDGAFTGGIDGLVTGGGDVRGWNAGAVGGTNTGVPAGVIMAGCTNGIATIPTFSDAIESNLDGQSTAMIASRHAHQLQCLRTPYPCCDVPGPALRYVARADESDSRR